MSEPTIHWSDQDQESLEAFLDWDAHEREALNVVAERLFPAEVTVPEPMEPVLAPIKHATVNQVAGLLIAILVTWVVAIGIPVALLVAFFVFHWAWAGIAFLGLACAAVLVSMKIRDLP